MNKEHKKLLEDLKKEPIVEPTQICRTYKTGDKLTHTDYNRMIGNVIINYANKGNNAILINNVEDSFAFAKDIIFKYDHH